MRKLPAWTWHRDRLATCQLFAEDVGVVIVAVTVKRRLGHADPSSGRVPLLAVLGEPRHQGGGDRLPADGLTFLP